MTTYFEILINEFHFLYVINTHAKFYTYRMLFTIKSKNLFFMHNFDYKKQKFQHSIDDIIIDL